MQIDDDLLNYNEVIINELLILYEKSVYDDDFIQSIKLYITSKNKNEKEIFNYLLDNKDKLQNIFLLANLYQHGIGTEKNEIKALELYSAEPL